MNNEIISIIKTRKLYAFSLSELLRLTNTTFDIFNELLFKTSIAHYSNKKSFKYENHNPILWEIGHVIYFWEFFFCRLIDNDQHKEILFKNVDQFYNSFKIPLTERFNHLSITDINTYYEFVINQYIYKWLFTQKEINCKDPLYYAFMICLLHTHMHIESILYTRKLLSFSFDQPKIKLNANSYYTFNVEDYNNIEFVKINGNKDNFYLGALNNGKNMVWDNELSRHKCIVNTFYVSKHPITIGQYAKFIDDDKYNKNSGNWSFNGRLFLKKTKAKCPLYWKKHKNSWYIYMNNKWYSIRDYNTYTLPVFNISWYEAEAYCKYAGVRLMTEAEWEYMASECGTNYTIDYDKFNMDYKESGPISVYNTHMNKLGVCDVFGNVWCWCQDVFRPYPNFNIDPLYQEFSYPFFGYKNILRGGCFATPSILINHHYRNAQAPDTRKQFAGFRVCKIFQEDYL